MPRPFRSNRFFVQSYTWFLTLQIRYARDYTPYISSRPRNGAFDHFDDLLPGHFYFAAGFDGVAVGELTAVDDAQDYHISVRSSSKPGRMSSPETREGFSRTAGSLSGR